MVTGVTHDKFTPRSTRLIWLTMVLLEAEVWTVQTSLQSFVWGQRMISFYAPLLYGRKSRRYPCFERYFVWRQKEVWISDGQIWHILRSETCYFWVCLLQSLKTRREWINWTVYYKSISLCRKLRVWWAQRIGDMRQDRCGNQRLRIIRVFPARLCHDTREGQNNDSTARSHIWAAGNPD